MHAFADLRARADQRVRIDHRLVIDVRADVHERGRHHDHAFADVRAATNRRTAGHDAHGVLRLEAPRRNRIFVDERKRARCEFGEHAELEGGQDPFLHPGVRLPDAVGVARRGARSSFFELGEKKADRLDRFHAIGGRLQRADAFFDRRHS